MRNSDLKKIPARIRAVPQKIKPLIDGIKAYFTGRSLKDILRDKNARVFLAIGLGVLLCLGGLTPACVQCACSSGCPDCGGSGSREMVFLGGSQPLESMEFLEDTYYISAGSRLALRLRTQPETFDDIITWRSSDATVLRVDAEGVVTAVAQGTAVITAESGNLAASVTISVVDDILVEAADCIRMLSEGCDDYTLSAAQLMLDRLERCTADGADSVSNVISEIISYADNGDRTALSNAIDASRLDGTICRTAAAYCWAYGEQQRCDAVLSFAGDCTLARFNEDSGKGRFPSVYEASGSPTYPFDLVKGIFACDDITVVNFEGTLTDSVKHQDKTFFFRGSPAYARILPEASIEAANLANNHSLDYYQTGYDDTVNHLTDAGVYTVRSEQPLTVYAGEKSIPVVMLAGNFVGGERENLISSLVDEIKQHDNERTVTVVNLHWGTEGSSYPEKWQRDAAHRLIDAGADLIVGHHPHVLQGIEIYKDRCIAYSLGNFAFGGNISANSPQTIILRARLSADEYGNAGVEGISLLPCKTTSTGTKVNNYQPMLCFGGEGDRVYSGFIRLGSNINGAYFIDRPDI